MGCDGGSRRPAAMTLDGPQRRQETGDDGGARWAATAALDGDGAQNRGAGGRAEEPLVEEKIGSGWIRLVLTLTLNHALIPCYLWIIRQERSPLVLCGHICSQGMGHYGPR